MEPDSTPFAENLENSERQSADGTLVVVVCRGKHLPNRRKLDKQSPYVTLRIGTTAKKTTSHFRAGQTPEWTQEIRFPLTRDKRPIMKVDVLDETKNDPTPVGSTEIDCAIVFSSENNNEGGKYIHDDWYNLELNGRNAGKIYLEMTFYPHAPILPPKIEQQYIYKDAISQDNNSKTYAAPPKHPAQSRIKNVGDDIFVSLSGSDKSSISKRLSLLKHSQSTLSNPPLGSARSSFEEDVFVQAEEKESSGGKFAEKFRKFKSKFESKEPITTLWHSPKRNQSPPGEEMDQQKGKLPIKKYYQLPSSNEKWYQDIAESDEDEEMSFAPPAPPPHLVSSVYEEELPSLPHKHINPKSRKPPPNSDFEFRSQDHKKSSIPFSADSIGVESESDLIPSNVYMLGEPVKPLSQRNQNDNGAYQLNPNEIDPKFYAPTPSEQLAQTLRLQNGNIQRNDIAIDLRTAETGYLGDGKFSPSVFDRINGEYKENKPAVPPKIPKGLTEVEYYVLEREKYLSDLKGNRI